MTNQPQEDIVLCGAEHSLEELERFAADHLIAEDAAARTAELFKTLADPTRLRIIGLLSRAEMCVGDLQTIMRMSQPAISHHLRLLRNLRLVRSRKDGRHVYYRLDDVHVTAIFEQGLEHALHD